MFPTSRRPAWFAGKVPVNRSEAEAGRPPADDYAHSPLRDTGVRAPLGSTPLMLILSESCSCCRPAPRARSVLERCRWDGEARLRDFVARNFGAASLDQRNAAQALPSSAARETSKENLKILKSEKKSSRIGMRLIEDTAFTAVYLLMHGTRTPYDVRRSLRFPSVKRPQ
jgi:hypothetical protein